MGVHRAHPPAIGGSPGKLVEIGGAGSTGVAVRLLPLKLREHGFDWVAQDYHRAAKATARVLGALGRPAAASGGDEARSSRAACARGAALHGEPLLLLLLLLPGLRPPRRRVRWVVERMSLDDSVVATLSWQHAEE